MQWVKNHGSDGRVGVIRDLITSVPTAAWFGGWESDVAKEVNTYVSGAAAAKALPVLVAYWIPHRDCGGASSGGAGSPDDYRRWVQAFAGAIGARPALVVLEPDALAHLECLSSSADRSTRLALLNEAVDTFARLAPGAWVYLDAGNSGWHTPAETAQLLLQAGIARTRGFALNVANYRTTSESTAYGREVNSEMFRLAGVSRPFVIDTARNGHGPGSTWCDPAGRKVGTATQVLSVGGQPEMALWVKPPGEADGCVASSGGFNPDVAYRLALGL